MAIYRVTIISIEPGPAVVNMDTRIERQFTNEAGDPDWVLIPSGHRTLQINAPLMLEILENAALPLAEKKNRIKNLIVREAKKSQIEIGDAAYEALSAIQDFPVSFPVTA